MNQNEYSNSQHEIFLIFGRLMIEPGQDSFLCKYVFKRCFDKYSDDEEDYCCAG